MNDKKDMSDEEKEHDRLMKWASRSGQKERVRAMVDLAKPDLAIRTESLDLAPWLFNCQNGTIDLRNGNLLPHQRDDLLTKISPIKYDPDAIAPTWQNFLDQIFASNKTIESYVQRFLGYSLTGMVSEQALAFLHGEGANGKTTFVNAIRDFFGDYAQEAAPDMLLEKRFSGIPNDLARLRGARFVSVTETSDGRRFDEGIIKRLTGGDRITARFLKAEYFEFEPSHKLWLISNHKPIIKGQDFAIWRRIKLIPFEVIFADHEQDKSLPDKLKEELPGILAWAVRGCLDWQQVGLNEPDEVKIATGCYKSEMDVVQRFIDECCTVEQRLSVMANGLYMTYQEWSEKAGEENMTMQAFGRRLTAKGFASKHTRNGECRLGLQLRVLE